MKFKKLLIAGIAVLGLASISGVSANASSYFSRDISEAEGSSTKYARHSMDLERLSHGSVFAYIHQTGHKWIHRGEAIKVAPFYHMGHDGFIVHIPENSGIYYAPTNSYRWYKNSPKYHWVKITRHKTVFNKEKDEDVSPKFKRTNNKQALAKSGYHHISEFCIFNKYAPNDKRARIPKNIKFHNIPIYQYHWVKIKRGDPNTQTYLWDPKPHKWWYTHATYHRITYHKWIKVRY